MRAQTHTHMYIIIIICHIVCITHEYIYNNLSSPCDTPPQINQTADFSSRACICNDVYYTLWWKLPDPSNAENRLYGIASIDESGPGSGSRATYSEAELPDNYYGIWCDPTDRLNADRRVDAKKSQTSAAAAAASLLLLRSTKQDGGDPLRADTFYVDRHAARTFS